MRASVSVGNGLMLAMCPEWNTFHNGRKRWWMVNSYEVATFSGLHCRVSSTEMGRIFVDHSLSSGVASCVPAEKSDFGTGRVRRLPQENSDGGSGYRGTCTSV